MVFNFYGKCFETERRYLNSTCIFFFFFMNVRGFVRNDLTNQHDSFCIFVFRKLPCFAKMQFLCTFVGYSALNCAIGTKSFAFSRDRPSIGTVCKISPICWLLTIVVANNSLFTDFIYVRSVLSLFC